MSNELLWSKFLENIKSSVNSMVYSTWFSKTYLLSLDNNVATIVVPLDIHKKRLNESYRELIISILTKLTGNVYDLDFVLESDAKIKKETNIKIEEIKPSELNLKHNSNLNPKYTFDTFIVGNNNRLAQAAALAVAEAPGDVYNPLFIYGDAGLGKTHLMHSIAHFIIDHNDKSKVLYVTSEDFTNEVIRSIRTGNNAAMTKFREKYRNIDVLLIDDIQFIIGKDSTQEEFFHTFNALHSAKKQIILSSDKPPRDMDVLDSRYRSRFEWGLTCDITLPDYETRVAILHKKEELDGIHFNDEIIQFIAENINSNIRELEGALNKVLAYARINNIEMTQGVARDVLKDIISAQQERVVSINTIIEQVAEHFSITPEDIRGSNRSSKFTLPRQIFMYLCREILNMNYNAIGDYLNGRDHSTVMYGTRKMDKSIQDDDNIRATVQIIRMKILPES